MIAPLGSPKLPSKVERQTFLYLSDFSRSFITDVKESGGAYGLVIKIEYGETEIPKVVQHLLTQFPQLTSEPTQLPPMRDI